MLLWLKPVEDKEPQQGAAREDPRSPEASRVDNRCKVAEMPLMRLNNELRKAGRHSVPEEHSGVQRES